MTGNDKGTAAQHRTQKVMGKTGRGKHTKIKAYSRKSKENRMARVKGSFVQSGETAFPNFTS